MKKTALDTDRSSSRCGARPAANDGVRQVLDKMSFAQKDKTYLGSKECRRSTHMRDSVFARIKIGWVQSIDPCVLCIVELEDVCGEKKCWRW